MLSEYYTKFLVKCKVKKLKNMQQRYAENSEVYREKIILGTANNANGREWEKICSGFEDNGRNR